MTSETPTCSRLRRDHRYQTFLLPPPGSEKENQNQGVSDTTTIRRRLEKGMTAWTKGETLLTAKFFVICTCALGHFQHSSCWERTLQTVQVSKNTLLLPQSTLIYDFNLDKACLPKIPAAPPMLISTAASESTQPWGHWAYEGHTPSKMDAGEILVCETFYLWREFHGFGAAFMSTL